MAKKHKFHTTKIEHHKDGSATVHHMHEDGEKHDVRHGVTDLDAVHDSMQDHLGGPPSDGDQELDKGIHGVPSAQAASAGLPIAPVGPTGA
jgi:hypothetical protein